MRAKPRLPAAGIEANVLLCALVTALIEEALLDRELLAAMI